MLFNVKENEYTIPSTSYTEKQDYYFTSTRTSFYHVIHNKQNHQLQCCYYTLQQKYYPIWTKYYSDAQSYSLSKPILSNGRSFILLQASHQHRKHLVLQLYPLHWGITSPYFLELPSDPCCKTFLDCYQLGYNDHILDSNENEHSEDSISTLSSHSFPSFEKGGIDILLVFEHGLAIYRLVRSTQAVIENSHKHNNNASTFHLTTLISLNQLRIYLHKNILHNEDLNNVKRDNQSWILTSASIQITYRTIYCLSNGFLFRIDPIELKHKKISFLHQALQHLGLTKREQNISTIQWNLSCIYKINKRLYESVKVQKETLDGNSSNIIVHYFTAKQQICQNSIENKTTSSFDIIWVIFSIKNEYFIAITRSCFPIHYTLTSFQAMAEPLYIVKLQLFHNKFSASHNALYNFKDAYITSNGRFYGCFMDTQCSSLFLANIQLPLILLCEDDMIDPEQFIQFESYKCQHLEHCSVESTLFNSLFLNHCFKNVPNHFLTTKQTTYVFITPEVWKFLQLINTIYFNTRAYEFENQKQNLKRRLSLQDSKNEFYTFSESNFDSHERLYHLEDDDNNKHSCNFQRQQQNKTMPSCSSSTVCHSKQKYDITTSSTLLEKKIKPFTLMGGAENVEFYFIPYTHRYLSDLPIPNSSIHVDINKCLQHNFEFECCFFYRTLNQSQDLYQVSFKRYLYLPFSSVFLKFFQKQCVCALYNYVVKKKEKKLLALIQLLSESSFFQSETYSKRRCLLMLLCDILLPYAKLHNIINCFSLFIPKFYCCNIDLLMFGIWGTHTLQDLIQLPSIWDCSHFSTKHFKRYCDTLHFPKTSLNLSRRYRSYLYQLQIFLRFVVYRLKKRNNKHHALILLNNKRYHQTLYEDSHSFRIIEGASIMVIGLFNYSLLSEYMDLTYGSMFPNNVVSVSKSLVSWIQQYHHILNQLTIEKKKNLLNKVLFYEQWKDITTLEDHLTLLNKNNQYRYIHTTNFLTQPTMYAYLFQFCILNNNGQFSKAYHWTDTTILNVFTNIVEHLVFEIGARHYLNLVDNYCFAQMNDNSNRTYSINKCRNDNNLLSPNNGWELSETQTFTDMTPPSAYFICTLLYQTVFLIITGNNGSDIASHLYNKMIEATHQITSILIKNQREIKLLRGLVALDTLLIIENLHKDTEEEKKCDGKYTSSIIDFIKELKPLLF